MLSDFKVDFKKPLKIGTAPDKKTNSRRLRLGNPEIKLFKLASYQLFKLSFFQTFFIAFTEQKVKKETPDRFYLHFINKKNPTIITQKEKFAGFLPETQVAESSGEPVPEKHSAACNKTVAKPPLIKAAKGLLIG